jgi:hypothetical protein
LLPTRDAGGSDAAAAGARIGSVSLAADAHDPTIIMAALGRVANGIAAEPAPARSLFTPASAAKVAASAAPVLEQASVFAVDSAPATASVPAAAPAASSAPFASPAPAVSSIPRSLTPDPADVAGTAAAPGTARVPGGAGTQGGAPSVVKPVSTAGRAPYARRPVPSKPLIAVAILVCLAATIWALFS